MILDKRSCVFGELWSRETEKDKERDMVGSGAGGDRSKDAVGMMALHEALRSVCLNSDWIYSVFWTIRPRPYTHLSFSLSLFINLSLFLYLFSVPLSDFRRVRGGNGCKIGDESGSLWVFFSLYIFPLLFRTRETETALFQLKISSWNCFCLWWLI